jgi:spore coat polysaccharide biosynthesis predicted glycosyltransferase SpsG/RimJ/RimL family protein N-acetyltransferase
VLFVDDNGHAGAYSADIVLNQNVHASRALYANRDPATRLLLGPRFAMLRREFRAWRDWKREIPPAARRVLVTMGGSDPDNVTGRVVQAILTEHDLEATVVVGGSNPHLPELRASVGQHSESVRLIENVTNMPELMTWADMAVAGAGTTSLEMCFLGLPALLIVLADNQRLVAEELSRRGLAIYLREGAQTEASVLAGNFAELAASAQARRAMSERGREQVDGRGAERVVQSLRTSEIEMRRAESSDCRLLWELANDPAVRASAFSHEVIPWEHHVAWFHAKLSATNCRILIAQAARQFVGQVRIDLRSDLDGDIDISVAREFRGMGVSVRLIDLAVREIFETTGLARIHAYILPDNLRSMRAFEKAEFHNIGEEVVKENRANHYIREKYMSHTSGLEKRG